MTDNSQRLDAFGKLTLITLIFPAIVGLADHFVMSLDGLFGNLYTRVKYYMMGSLILWILYLRHGQSRLMYEPDTALVPALKFAQRKLLEFVEKRTSYCI